LFYNKLLLCHDTKLEVNYSHQLAIKLPSQILNPPEHQMPPKNEKVTHRINNQMLKKTRLKINPPKNFSKIGIVVKRGNYKFSYYLPFDFASSLFLVSHFDVVS